MPKLSLLLGRKTIQIYDIDQTKIVVGREPDVDVLIDNPSVSRKHAELRKEGEGWVVQDLGSSNGTFLHGEKIEEPTPLKPGDEIGFGKFSLVFEKALGEAKAEKPAPKKPQPTMTGGEGTMHIKSHEVSELLKDSERQRRAHLIWESGGQRGNHYLSEAPAALFGRSDLCDVKVPKAPKHHVLVVNREQGCEVRNLHWWTSMKVRGRKTKKAVLKDGDVVEVGGLKLTFVGDIS